MPAQHLSRSADSLTSAGVSDPRRGARRHPRGGLLRAGPGRRSLRGRIRVHHPVVSARPRLQPGGCSDPSWLEGPGYDLVPLPKYFINLAFRAAGISRPTRRDAIAWYANTSYRWGTTRELTIARLPSILTGALACVAIFALGTLVAGPWAGGIAAFLLAVNPLFRLHAHRAMSEASCEAFLLLALALGLWAWKALLAHAFALPRSW